MKEQIKEMGKLCPFYEEGKCNLLEDEAAECNFDCDMCDFARTLLPQLRSEDERR